MMVVQEINRITVDAFFFHSNKNYNFNSVMVFDIMNIVSIVLIICI